MSKYESLWQHLQNDGHDTFQLTFEEIKAITGFDIDHSFLTYKKEAKEYGYDAVPEIATVGHNISIMQKTGYVPVAAFTLPENCWTDNYFVPQKARQEEFLKKHAGNKTVEDFIAFMRQEVELYSKYRQYYGYVFYIGRKI